MHTVPLVTPLAPNTLAEAVIDLDAIANNVRVLSDHAGSAEVMAVVKADGYGHGATQVSRTALAAGATELGVATIDEALALRRDGITAPTLAWLHPPGTDFAAGVAVRHREAPAMLVAEITPSRSKVFDSALICMVAID